MSLSLSILSGPKAAGVTSREVAPGGFSIGRAADNDWVLADPGRHLSKRHCVISLRGSYWEITDLSTNGTFLNHEPVPIGQRAVRDLRDGDRLRLGTYELAVTVVDDPRDVGASDACGREAGIADMRTGDGGRGAARGESDVMRNDPDAPAALDPLSPPGSSLEPFSLSPPAADMDRFDLSVQSDHSPGIEDAFAPPRPIELLGEDWNLSSTPAAAPAAGPPAGLSHGFIPVASVAAAAEPAASDLMAAFLRGAGMADAHPADPVAAMEALGASFRALVSGLRETLMARAAVKSEFRIEQTMIRTRGNNPLKFSASDDDALLALVGTGRRTEIGPAEAVAEALHDIRLHELATMAAMQSAIGELLRAFAPSKLRGQADQTGPSLLPHQRKARAWDAFEAAHNRLTQALSDNFDSAFGRAFARAYEQALHEAGRDRVGD